MRLLTALLLLMLSIPMYGQIVFNFIEDTTGNTLYSGPQDAAELVGWWESDRYVLDSIGNAASNTDGVYTWQDMSGYGNDLLAGFGNPPLLKDNRINGLPSIDFSGLNRHLVDTIGRSHVESPDDVGDTLNYGVVIIITNTTGSEIRLLGDLNYYFGLLVNSSEQIYIGGGGTGNVRTTTQITSWKYVHFEYVRLTETTSQVKVYVNNTLEYQILTFGGFLGGMDGGWAIGEPVSTPRFEITFWAAWVGGQDRNLMWNYVSNKYGL